jgi:hypothetical protein
VQVGVATLDIGDFREPIEGNREILANYKAEISRPSRTDASGAEDRNIVPPGAAQ